MFDDQGRGMSSTRHRQAISALATTLMLALWLDAAPPTAAQTPISGSLAGQLLVASPTMGDPRFAHTVILMVRHNKDGAFGIVINRPIGERPLAALLQLFGDNEPAVPGDVRIFAGGPVQPEAAFVVHSPDYHGAGTLDLNERAAVTSSREILRDIGHGKGPGKSLIAFGYAGWGPGQLEGELARRDWAIAPADSKLIYELDRDKVWDAAYAQRMQDL
jgi:putative transcriptional regulator